MTDLDVPDGMALACRTCAWRPGDNLTIGVLAAHFEAEHDTSKVELDLIVLCPRCDKPMNLFATVGNEDHFTCDLCHRDRKIRSNQ